MGSETYDELEEWCNEYDGDYFYDDRYRLGGTCTFDDGEREAQVVLTNGGLGEDVEPDGFAIEAGGEGAKSIETGFNARENPGMGSVLSIDGDLDEVKFGEAGPGGPRIMIDGKRYDFMIED